MIAVYVVDPYPYLSIAEVNPLGFSAYIQAANSFAAEIHNAVVTLANTIAPTVSLECLLIEDTSISQGIVQSSASQHCDLIVIGAHGRGSIGRFLLGSVTTKVVNEAAVPVLVAR